jgi:hypothetical protein
MEPHTKGTKDTKGSGFEILSLIQETFVSLADFVRGPLS